MPSFTLTGQSSVALSGNFAGANVVPGALYYVVLATGSELSIIGQITAQTFSTGARFTITVSLPAGTYNLGTVPTGRTAGTPGATGAVGAPSIYIVNTAGNSGGGASSEDGQGAANITSTLSARNPAVTNPAG